MCKNKLIGPIRNRGISTMSENRVPTGLMLRTAIIGCGRVAGGYYERAEHGEVRTHARAYQLQPATHLVAVADQDIRRAHEFSARWGDQPVYEEAAKMLATVNPDIVSICTPDDTHADLLELCLGCPSVRAVWCEKPLTTEIDRAEAIVAAYAERGLVLAVNYQRRWDTEMQHIKRVVQQGELGNIQKVIVYYTKGICHNGSHAVDLLIDWFGLPSKIQVLGSRLDFLPDDPTVDARLLMGDVPVYLIGLDERRYSIFEIHILGTLGRVNIKSFGQEVEWFKRQTGPHLEGYQLLNSPSNLSETDLPLAMTYALQEIIQAIFTGKPVRSNGESALAVLRVCCELAAQAKKESDEL